MLILDSLCLIMLTKLAAVSHTHHFNRSLFGLMPAVAIVTLTGLYLSSAGVEDVL